MTTPSLYFTMAAKCGESSQLNRKEKPYAEVRVDFLSVRLRRKKKLPLVLLWHPKPRESRPPCLPKARSAGKGTAFAGGRPEQNTRLHYGPRSAPESAGPGGGLQQGGAGASSHGHLTLAVVCCCNCSAPSSTTVQPLRDWQTHHRYACTGKAEHLRSYLQFRASTGALRMCPRRPGGGGWGGRRL